MAIKIDYSNVKTAIDAFEAVKKNISPEFLEEKFKVKAALDYLKDHNQIKANGKGFNLNMKFLETHAEIDVELAFFLKPFQEKILSYVEHQLKKIL